MHPIARVIARVKPRDWTAIILGLIWLFLLLGLDIEPKAFQDNYFAKSKAPWWDGSLYLAGKPFGLYFFYKLAGHDPVWVIRLQCVLAAFSWTLLACILAAPIKRDIVAVFVIAAISLGALSWNIAGWHFCYLSESVTASTFAVFYGAFLWFWRQPNWRRFAFLLSTALYLGVLREQMPFFLLSFAGLAWLIAFFQRHFHRQRYLYASGLLVFSISLLGLTSWTSNRAQRHVVPFYNVLLKRILANPAHAAWFEKQGLPLSLLDDDPFDWEGKWASDHDMALFRNRDNWPMHEWVIKKGRLGLAHFLITHPGYVWQSAWDQRGDIFNGDVTDYTRPPPRTFPFTLARWLWTPWPLWLLGPLFAGYLWLIIKKNAPPWPLVLAICAVLTGLLSFHADAMEVARHCAFTGWALQTAAWHGLILVMGNLIRLRDKEMTTQTE